MQYAILELEVAAKKAGLRIEKPPVLRGRSGVEHRFSLLASEGPTLVGVDVYDSPTEVDVIRTFVKKWDTSSECFIYLGSGDASEGAKRLARAYGLRILGEKDLWEGFSPLAAPNSARQAIRSVPQ